MNDVLILVVAYLLGSIPFGLILTKIFGLGDIRNIGSGNIGATNVLRTGKKGLALATLLLDALKGVVAVLLAKQFASSENVILTSAILAVLGHVFPIWLKFKGGKGVATAIAIIIALNWVIGVISSVIWIVTFYLTRYSSLSSIFAVTSSVVLAFIFTGVELFITYAILAVIVVLRHKDNIKRLLAGEELKFGNK